MKLENDDTQDFDLRSDPFIGQSFRKSFRFQVARFLSSSHNYGTFQSRNSSRRKTARLSQTQTVCDVAP